MVREPGTIARTYGYLFGLGAVLLLVSLALPGDAEREALPIALVAVAYIALAIGHVAGYDRTPMWVLRASPALGSVLVSLVVYAGGPGSAAAYAMYYLAFVLVAAYFFEPRFMAPYVLLSAGGFGLALLALDVGSTGWLTWALVVGTLTIGAGLAAALRSQLGGLVASLTVAAATDPLTGLANRREFNRRLSQEFERSARAGRPLGMIVIDLDGFKRVNDVFGHDAGDRALRRFAQLLLENTREIDIVARTGGEEFAILAPDADAARARMVAERLRNSTERAFAPPEPLTASCGVADHEEGGLDAPELLRAADRALYAAKREGRNRTVVYDPEHHDAEHMELPADGWTTTLPLDASEAA